MTRAAAAESRGAGAEVPAFDTGAGNGLQQSRAGGAGGRSLVQWRVIMQVNKDKRYYHKLRSGDLLICLG